MDKSYVPCILTELRFVISQIRILEPNRTYINTPKEDVTTFLSRAIALIEWLDGALEDCEEAAEEDDSMSEYWKESYMEAKDELATVREVFNQTCEEARHNEETLRDEIKRLKFEKELAKKLIKQTLHERDVWREKARINAIDRDQNSDSATYWKCRCHKLEKAINDREMRNLIREKSDQEACKYCEREDCSNCTLCPF